MIPPNFTLAQTGVPHTISAALTATAAGWFRKPAKPRLQLVCCPWLGYSDLRGGHFLPHCADQVEQPPVRRDHLNVGVLKKSPIPLPPLDQMAWK